MTFKEYKLINEPKVKNTKCADKKYYYVYRITNKNTKRHYYGSRVCNRRPKEDLGITYFSSSYDKEFIAEQKVNTENFKYKVVRVCLDNVDKQLFESYLHDKFDVGVNKSFYNMVKQTVEGFDCTGHKFNLGRKLTEETKAKLRVASSNRIVSESTKEKHRLVALSRTKEENLLRGVAHKGKKISEHTRELLCKNNTGAGNPSAKTITVFDSKDNVVLISKGTFKKECEDNKLPWASLRRAKDGKKLYIASDGSISGNIPMNSRKFIGWYIQCK